MNRLRQNFQDLKKKNTFLLNDMIKLKYRLSFKIFMNVLASLALRFNHA